VVLTEPRRRGQFGRRQRFGASRFAAQQQHLHLARLPEGRHFVLAELREPLDVLTIFRQCLRQGRAAPDFGPQHVGRGSQSGGCDTGGGELS
jgi:hypothetical protein